MIETTAHENIRKALTSEPQDFARICSQSGVPMALAREVLLELQQGGEADLVYGFGWHLTSEDLSNVYQGTDIEETWTELEDGTKFFSIEIHRDEDDIEARFTLDEARNLALSIFGEIGTIKGTRTVHWAEGDLVEREKEYGVVQWMEPDTLIVKVPGDDENRKWPAAQCRLLRRN